MIEATATQGLKVAACVKYAKQCRTAVLVLNGQVATAAVFSFIPKPAPGCFEVCMLRFL